MRSLLLAILALTAISSTVFAQAPDSLGFQGFLTNVSGEPLDSTGVVLTFKLYKGSTAVWTDTHHVSVSNGVFNVLLGKNVPLDTVVFNQAIDLGVKVGTDPEMSPRTPLAAAAYAKALPGFYTFYRDTGDDMSYNVVGGAPNNIVWSSAVGATIGGGGGYNYGEPVPNSVGNPFTTVSGGAGNRATDYYATVGGGNGNRANSPESVICGGGHNYIGAGPVGTIAGGAYNKIRDNAYGSLIAGGIRNKAYSFYTSIGGGEGNIVGDSLSIAGSHATTAGGRNNIANGDSSTVAGGAHNTASGTATTVGGGSTNTSSGLYGTIGGGVSNIVDSEAATVAGGARNYAGGESATVSGGEENRAESYQSTVGGGWRNETIGLAAVIGGGRVNTTFGWDATVPGGRNNYAEGSASFAAGLSSHARHQGSFVWQDFTGTSSDTLASTGSNQFLARASGGVTFLTAAAPNLTTGSNLPAGSGTWTALSSESSKTNFNDVDAASYLDRVASLNLKEWSYKTEQGVTHVGPMAEDFYAAFGHGPTERGISGVDGDGVALAAIQGLYELVQELQAENAEMRAAMARAGIE